jgi:hypothetical protein
MKGTPLGKGASKSGISIGNQLPHTSLMPIDRRKKCYPTSSRLSGQSFRVMFPMPLQVPSVVEIVGPAGAGKTTLLETLLQGERKIAPDIHLSRTTYSKLLLSNGARWLPSLFLRHRKDRWFTWRETRSMVYLKGWHEHLRREKGNNHSITVLDHGPIYRLALLREFGPEIRKSRGFKDWWESTVSQWGSLLDLVIWLDAPDPILRERVEHRQCAHQMKGRSQGEVQEFMARYRASYELIIGKMTSQGRTRVLSFDTGREPLSAIAERVLAEFKPEPVAC